MKNNLSTKIISLLFAIGMWFYIIQVQSPEVERTVKNVPVFFSQRAELEDRGFVLMNDKEYTVDLKIRGQRKFLTDIDASDINVSVDVSKIDKTGEHSINTIVAIPYGNIQVLKQTPASINITVDELVEEKKEIKVVTTGTPKEGYVVGETKATPETVKIRGAKSIVGAIDHVTATIDVDGKKEDVSSVVSLEMVSTSGTKIDNPYVTCSEETVDVHCEILKKKTVTLEPVFSSDLNTKNEWYVLDDNALKSVEIAGPLSTLENLSKVKTEVITREMIGKDDKVEVKLVLPAGISCLDGDRLTLKLKRETKK